MAAVLYCAHRPVVDKTLPLLTCPTCSLSAKSGDLQDELRAAQAAADAATQARAAAEAAARRQAQDVLVAQEQLEAARRGRDEAAREAAELEVGGRGSRVRVRTEGVEGRAKTHVGLPPMWCLLQPSHTRLSILERCLPPAGASGGHGGRFGHPHRQGGVQLSHGGG